MNSLNPLNKRVVAIFFDFFLKLTLGAWHGNRSGLVLPLGKVGTTDISQLRLVIDDHATAEIRIN